MLLFNIKYTVENSCHTFSHTHANNNFYSAISVFRLFIEQGSLWHVLQLLVDLVLIPRKDVL